MPQLKRSWLFLSPLVSAFISLAVPISPVAEARVDDSVSIFFPKELKNLELTQTQFPFFWWNFIIIDPQDKGPSLPLAQNICDSLHSQHRHRVARIVCGDRMESFLPQLKAWGLDLPHRTPYSHALASDFHNRLNNSVSQVSMLSNPLFLELLRHDPFSEWSKLLKDSSVRGQAFSMHQGFLFDQESKRILIPIQFSVPPQKAQIEELMGWLLALPKVHVLGAHASSYINQSQVMQDLNIVSVVGSLSLIAFALFLIVKGRKNIIFLYLPVFVAVGLASLVTQWIFGSIHGLTLAFGSGIIGLVLDYGLHGAFNIHSRQTWKSNSIGMLTTLVGLSGLLFCSIPLIRQMMVFAIMGLAIGYGLFFYLCHRHARFFAIEGLLYQIPHFRSVATTTLLLALAGVLVSTRINWSVDLKAMNFHRSGETDIAQWFYGKSDMGEMLLAVHPASNHHNEEQRFKEYQFSEAKKIAYEGIDKYFPPSAVRSRNRETWQNLFCPTVRKEYGQTVQRLFAPFFDTNCNSTEAATTGHFPTYLSHLTSSEGVLSVFFAQHPAQSSDIRAAFPYFSSVTESLQSYSRIFESDLRKIIPLAFLACFAMLYAYYRRVIFVLSSILPFLCGTGIFFIYLLLAHKQVDLMGLVGLIMVFCFSLDYGIFATDIVAFPQAKENAIEIRSSLSFAAITNLLGYFPLIFAKHVVLFNLGMALFLGTLGTYLGCIWGTPVVANWRPNGFDFAKWRQPE